MNSMEQLTKETTPFTNQTVLKLLNGMTFDQAAALFNVDPSIFKARLQQLHFFLEKFLHGSLIKIPAGDCEVTIVLKYMKNGQCMSFHTMDYPVSLRDVTCLIEERKLSSPGCYKLTFKHPNRSIGNVVVKTDRDLGFVLYFSRSRGYYVFLDLEFFPSSQTADEVAYNELAYNEIAWFMPVWDLSYEDAAFDEDSCDEDSYFMNVFFEDVCDEIVMEHVTKEAVLSLNNGSTTFEEALAFFNVDLSTFRRRLEQLNIFVWKEPGGSLVRIHGGDYEMTIVIKTVKDKYYYTVHSTETFESVISMIEEYLELSPGCYKLTFKHPSKKYGNVWVKTDRDWHFVVFFSSFGGYLVYLDLEVFPPSQTADEDACDEDAKC